MSDVGLGNMWIFGYWFFTSFYYFCNALTSIRTAWQVAILFPKSGDWKLTEIQGDEYCRSLIETLI